MGQLKRRLEKVEADLAALPGGVISHLPAGYKVYERRVIVIPSVEITPEGEEIRHEVSPSERVRVCRGARRPGSPTLWYDDEAGGWRVRDDSTHDRIIVVASERDDEDV